VGQQGHRIQKSPHIEGGFLQLIYQVRFDVDVYGSVSGECPATLFVPTEAADQVRILHLVVKVPDKSPSRQMRRGNIGNAFLFHLTGCGIDDRYFPGDAASSENLFDILIVTLLGNEREQGRNGIGSRHFFPDCLGLFFLGIAIIDQCFILHIIILLQDRKCRLIQGNIDRYGMPVFGLPGNVTDAFAIAF